MAGLEMAGSGSSSGGSSWDLLPSSAEDRPLLSSPPSKRERWLSKGKAPLAGIFAKLARNRDSKPSGSSSASDFARDARQDQQALQASKGASERLQASGGLTEAEVSSFAAQARTLDLLFLLDVTGSMQPHINAVKEQMRLIAANTAKRSHVQCFRVAVIGYRDYDDSKPLEVLDFVDTYAPFKCFLAALKATGGRDVAEDVFSGIEAASRLSWEGGSRLIFHIADAPCHGMAFHALTEAGDSYPAGDKKGRDHAQLLLKLALDCRVDSYLFAHLNGTTKRMLTKFKADLGKQYEGWLLDQDGVDTLSVSTASSDSLTASKLLGKRGTAYVPEILDSNNSVTAYQPKLEGTFLYARPQPVGTLSALLERIASGAPLAPLVCVLGKLKLASKPFSKGSFKWASRAKAYLGEDKQVAGGGVCVGQDKKVVAVSKKFFTPDDFKDRAAEFHTQERYLVELHASVLAGALAELYTARIGFVRVLVGCFGSQHYVVEQRLQGSFIKWSNNSGYVNFAHEADHLHAFSHWTHHVTDGRLLVTDLQGTKEGHADAPQYKLTDPAIHTASAQPLCRTDHGVGGMKNFRATHTCNPVCEALGLFHCAASADDSAMASWLRPEE